MLKSLAMGTPGSCLDHSASRAAFSISPARVTVVHDLTTRPMLVAGGWGTSRRVSAAPQRDRRLEVHSPHRHADPEQESWAFAEDAALRVGQTFEDPRTGLSSTNLGEDDEGARIRVELP
jgi:hypothetical protein